MAMIVGLERKEGINQYMRSREDYCIYDWIEDHLDI